MSKFERLKSIKSSYSWFAKVVVGSRAKWYAGTTGRYLKGEREKAVARLCKVRVILAPAKLSHDGGTPRRANGKCRAVSGSMKWKYQQAARKRRLPATARRQKVPCARHKEVN